MKSSLRVLILLLSCCTPLAAQELDCDVQFQNESILSAEARDNLTDFLNQARQYINSYRWTQEDLGDLKIKCAITISFQGSPRPNHYSVQAFIASTRPIFRSDRNTAVVRFKDDSWEFDYVRGQPFIHSDSRFDPVLSFLDFYAYIMLGYDFDSYRAGDGTPYFQKALEIANRARGSVTTDWEASTQSTYSRGALIDELTSPKFQDFREAVYRYHYKGLDLLTKDEARARKNMLAALMKIANLRERINQRSLVIRTFFETKYQEITEIFSKDPDLTIFGKLGQIDPDHKTNYDEAARNPR